jgi:hypothetical protein
MAGLPVSDTTLWERLSMHGNAYLFWSGVGNDLPIYLIGVIPSVIMLVWRSEKRHREHLELLKQHHKETMEKK